MMRLGRYQLYHMIVMSSVARICWLWSVLCCIFLSFNDTATTEIYTYCHTLSLHDALPILILRLASIRLSSPRDRMRCNPSRLSAVWKDRSEEQTSELQSLMRISYAVFCWQKKKG